MKWPLCLIQYSSISTIFFCILLILCFVVHSHSPLDIDLCNDVLEENQTEDSPLLDEARAEYIFSPTLKS